MTLRTLRLPVVLLLAVLFVACTPDGGSIYHDIEGELKESDNTLPNTVTIFDLAKIGSTYYVGAGKIWTGTVAGSGTAKTITWITAEPLPVEAPTQTARCGALVVSPFDPARMYGAFFDDDTDTAGLYLSNAAPTFKAAGAETLPDAGSQVVLLKALNDGAPRLITVTARQPSAGSAFAYGVLYSASAGSYVPFTFAGTAGQETDPIFDVIYSTNFGAWYATEKTKLYTKAGAGAGDFTVAAGTGIPAGTILTGLFEFGSNLYVASTSGKVFYTADGSTWTPVPLDTTTLTPSFTRFAGPIGASTLLVGSDEHGYYTLNTADLGGTSPLVRFATTSSGLYTSSVRGFFLDGAESLAFALTTGNGLWRGDIGASDVSWDGQE